MLFDRQLLFLAFIFGLEAGFAAAVPKQREDIVLTDGTSRTPTHLRKIAQQVPSGASHAVSGARAASSSSCDRARRICTSTSVHSTSNITLPPPAHYSNGDASSRKSDSATLLPAQQATSKNNLGSPSASSTGLAFPFLEAGAGAGSLQPTARPASSTGTSAGQQHDAHSSSLAFGPFPNNTVTSVTFRYRPLQMTSGPSNTITNIALPPAPSSGVVGYASSGTGESTMSMASPNALSVLLSALPPSVASALESEYGLLPTTTSTHSTSTRPTTTSHSTTSHLSSSSSSTRSTSTSVTSTSISSTITPTTFSTIAQSPSTTSSLQNASTTTAPATSGVSLSSGAVAGIAIGVTAGVVFIFLAVFLLLRRRGKGGYPFGGRRDSAGSGRAYPEVAWLYDPAPTPPRHSSQHSRMDSNAALLPRRPPEMANINTAYTPSQMRSVDSPLLPPTMPVLKSNSLDGVSPNSSTSGSGGSNSPLRSSHSSLVSSQMDPRQPLNAIWESPEAQ